MSIDENKNNKNNNTNNNNSNSNNSNNSNSNNSNSNSNSNNSNNNNNKESAFEKTLRRVLSFRSNGGGRQGRSETELLIAQQQPQLVAPQSNNQTNACGDDSDRQCSPPVSEKREKAFLSPSLLKRDLCTFLFSVIFETFLPPPHTHTLFFFFFLFFFSFLFSFLSFLFFSFFSFFFLLPFRKATWGGSITSNIVFYF